MNDDHTPDLWLLAGDYLDGELDADEQARAEGDQDLMAVVAQLRSLRSDLRTPSEPSSGRREAAIVAALAAFDEVHVDPGVRPMSGRTRSADRARSGTRWLSAVAAAVVVVGGLGFVASQSGGGGDDDAAGGADAQLDSAPITTSATRAVPGQAEAESAFEDAATASASDMASVAADAAETGAPEAPVAVFESEEASGTGAGAPSATTASASEPYTFDPGQPIADPGQLAQAAEQLLDRADADELVNTPETSCGTDPAQPLNVLSEGLYRTADAVERRILVAVDDVRRVAVALDPDTCGTIAEAPLP